jgi:hypothetical protein
MDQPRNFERARNVDLVTRWAGDPERWGGNVEFSVLVTAGGGQFNTPGQALRAQCRDLMAISWDLFATWTLEGISDAHDELDLYLDVHLGTGQATSRALWKLSTKAIGAPPSLQNAAALTLGWEPFPGLTVGTYNGVAISGEPIVATTINATALLSIKHDVGIADHVVKLSLNAHCCPRSWVP